MSHIDHESVLLHAILNDDNSLKLFGLSRFVAPYNDKELREAANESVNQTQFVVPNDQSDAGTRDNKSRKRKIVDAEERAQSSRDRNREHAKNTRLRKKAYVIKLKDLVDQLKASKIAELEERQNIANQLLSIQSRRKASVMQFLKYRSQNVRSRVQWAGILNEKFSLTLPITPYRYFNKNEIEEGRRVLRGIDNVIADTASLSLMIECIGYGSQTWRECTLRGEFHKLLVDISPNDLVCSGDNVFCKFNMRIVHERTMLTSCLQSAMLHCRLDENDRLLTAELVFDVMHFVNQLQCANTIFPESSIVPNTLDMVLLDSNEARAIISRSSPNAILYVNQAWTTLTGHRQCDMEGVDFMSLFSTAQQALPSVHGLMRGCSRAIPGRVIINMVETSLFNEMFLADVNGISHKHMCYMKMIPLTSQSPTDDCNVHNAVITHFLVSLFSLDY